MRTLNFTLLTFISWLLLSCAATGPPAVDDPPVDKARTQAFCEKAAQQNMQAAAQRYSAGMPLEAILMEFAQFAQADGMNPAYRDATIELIASMFIDKNVFMAAYEKAVTVCVSLQ